MKEIWTISRILLLRFTIISFALLLVATVNRPASGDTGYVGAETCKMCHEKSYESYSKSIHSKKALPESPANKHECESCHGPGAAHADAGGGKGVGGVIALDSKKVSAEIKNAACLGCHETSKELAFWEAGAHKKNDVACTSCHRAHSKKSEKQYEICFGCHKNIRREVNKQSHHPIIEGKLKCSDCHNTHGTLSHGMIRAENINQLCYKCHADKRGPFVWEHPPVEENCLACHNSHGGKAPKLMTEKPPNLCEDCHDWSRHPGSIYDAKNAFTGSAPSSRFFARSCSNCHSSIHGSNAPVNPASGANSGKAFVR